MGFSHSQPLTLSDSQTLRLSHSRTLALSHSHTLTLSHSHTLTLSHCHTLTLSHSHTLTFPQTLDQIIPPKSFKNGTPAQKKHFIPPGGMIFVVGGMILGQNLNHPTLSRTLYTYNYLK